MIVAAYVVANEADQIAESLRSVKAYVDRFVIVDSIFATNPIEATHSTDETRAICEAICYPVPLVYIESDRKLRQEEARNAYLDAIDRDDWVLNLDGDEVLYADYAEVREVLAWLQHGESAPDALKLPILSAAVLSNGFAHEMSAQAYDHNPIIHTRGHAPRLFRNVAGLEYREVLHPNGVIDNQGAYVGEFTLTSRALRDDRLMLVNHHVRQSFASYLADAVWESANERQAQELTPVQVGGFVQRRVAGFLG